MYIAGAIETLLTIGLFFGIYTPYVGFIAFIHLLVAAAATDPVTKCWIWVIGESNIAFFGRLRSGCRHARLSCRSVSFPP